MVRFFYNDGGENGGGAKDPKVEAAAKLAETLGVQLAGTSDDDKDKEEKEKEEQRKSEEERIRTENEAAGANGGADPIVDEIPSVKIPKKAEAKKDEALPVQKTEDEIEEEKALAFLSKKYNKTITSLDDLQHSAEPTAEEKEKAAQDREDKKISFGLTTGIIKHSELKGFIADSSNPTELVYQQYKESQLEEDATLTEDDIRAEFDLKYGLDETNSSERQKKRGEKEIQLFANQILHNKYASVFELDAKFAQHEGAEQAQLTDKNFFASKQSQYTNDVESVTERCRKLRFSYNEGDTKASFDVEFDPEDVEVYADGLLSESIAKGNMKNGWDLNSLESQVINAIKLDRFDDIVAQAVNVALLKKQKGLKGALPQREGERAPAEQQTAVTKAAEDLKARLNN